MQRNRESKAKTFITFRFSTKCGEIGKAGRRLSLRFGSTLNAGKKGRQAFLTFRASTKCREIGKVRRRVSLHLEPAFNVGK